MSEEEAGCVSVHAKDMPCEGVEAGTPQRCLQRLSQALVSASSQRSNKMLTKRGSHRKSPGRAGLCGHPLTFGPLSLEPVREAASLVLFAGEDPRLREQRTGPGSYRCDGAGLGWGPKSSLWASPSTAPPAKGLGNTGHLAIHRANATLGAP